MARLAHMEICWKSMDLDGFPEHMRHCLADPQTRDHARVTVQLVINDLVFPKNRCVSTVNLRTRFSPEKHAY